LVRENEATENSFSQVQPSLPSEWDFPELSAHSKLEMNHLAKQRSFLWNIRYNSGKHWMLCPNSSSTWAHAHL